MTNNKKGTIGSSFESYLLEEGNLNEIDSLAVKRALTWQIEQAMSAQKMTKLKMAQRMKTSRTQVDRLLDPNNNKVSLQTLQRAAFAVGRKLTIELEL
jgi:predicted XRE-type DNA-binding protein